MCMSRGLNCIMPPHLLDRLVQSDDRDVRDAAIRTLVASAQMRGQRSVMPAIAGALATRRKAVERFSMRTTRNLWPVPT
jgi:hypothetical protein